MSGYLCDYGIFGFFVVVVTICFGLAAVVGFALWLRQAGVVRPHSEVSRIPSPESTGGLDEVRALLYEARAGLWRYHEILGPTPTLVRYGEHAEEAARAHEENMTPLRRRIDQVLGFPHDPA